MGVVLKDDVVWTYVVDADDFDLVDRLLYEGLAVDVVTAKYTRLYKAGLWDGKKRFYNVSERKFFSGLLGKAIEVLGRAKKGLHIEVDRNYQYRSFSYEEIVKKLQQLEGIDWTRFEQVQLPVLREALHRGRCSIRLATGGGKTEVIAGLAKVLDQERMLVLVHRIELLDQTYKRLCLRLGERVGRISSDVVNIGERVVVGMVQSILSKINLVGGWLQNDVDVLVIDECHHTSATTWVRIAQMCRRAIWRFGLSGTPIVGRSDKDWLLIGLTGDVIDGKSLLELAELGYAVKPEIWVIFDERLVFSGLKKVKGKYMECYRRVFTDFNFLCVVVDVVKNLLDQFGGGIIVFTERVDICDALFLLLSRKFEGVARSYGSSPKFQRLAILEGFRNERVKILVTTTILDEGVDVQGVNAVVFACPGKSIVRVMQRIGRGVRPKQGKQKVVVCEFGIVAPWFKEHLQARLKIYKRENFNVRLATLHNGILKFEQY